MKINKIERLLELIISLVIAIITFGFSDIFGHIHRYMTKGRSEKYYRTSYSEFKKQFNNVNWISQPEWNKSLFVKINSIEDHYYNHLHAGIFIINGVGMILTDYGYFRASILIRRKNNELREFKKIKKIKSVEINSLN